MSPGLETDGSGQFELPVVEAPESFRAELKGTGDVKAMHRADPEFCRMPAGRVCAEIESLFRHIDPKPQSAALVILKLAVQLLCLGRAEFSINLSQGLSPLRRPGKATFLCAFAFCLP